MVSWLFVEPIWMEEFAAGIMSISELKVDIDILPPLARLGRKTILTLTLILSQLRQNITAMQLLTIGELSKKTGTTSVAIRHYERFGLICNDIRKSSGYRLYHEETIKAMIKTLQQLEASCDGKRPLSQCPILESLYASNKD